jgi:hypothetical protein
MLGCAAVSSDEGTAGAPAPRAARARRGIRPRDWLRVAKWASLALVALVALVFGALHGLNYGISNHNSYLFGGLRLVDPELYGNDWLVSQTKNYHLAFEFVAAALFELGRSGRSFAIASLVCTAACVGAIYWIITALVRRREALACFLLVMAVNVITTTASAGKSYITEGILQPSSFGSLGILLGIGFFLRGRWIASGVALAVGGLFHGNYAILAILIFGTAHVLLREGDVRRRFIGQFGPLVPILLMLAPLILASALDPDTKAAREIYFKMRSPHHYSPKGFETAFIPVAGWTALGLGAGRWILKRGDAVADRLGAALFGLSAVIWAGTLATTAFDISSAQQLFVARLCPFSDVMYEILACAGAVRVLLRPASTGKLREIPKDALVLVVLGLSLVGMYEGNRRTGGEFSRSTLMLSLLVRTAGAVVVLKVLSLAAAASARRPTIAEVRRFALRHGGWAAIAAATWITYAEARDKIQPALITPHLFHGSGGDKELYAWIHAHTPKDAVFLSPPEVEGFRLNAERAIVVDWKTPPFLPKEVLEWHHRLTEVAGRRVGSLGDATNGYRELDAKRVETLRSKYNIRYVVTRVGSRVANASAYAPVFQSGAYVVLDATQALGPGAAPARAPDLPAADPSEIPTIQ